MIFAVTFFQIMIFGTSSEQPPMPTLSPIELRYRVYQAANSNNDPRWEPPEHVNWGQFWRFEIYEEMSNNPNLPDWAPPAHWGQPPFL